MPGPCSDDLRMIAVEKVQAGESRRSVAKQLRAAASTVTGWFQRYSDTGPAGSSPMGGCREPKLAGHRIWVLDRIEACPATALAGLLDLIRERNRPDAERRRKQ